MGETTDIATTDASEKVAQETVAKRTPLDYVIQLREEQAKKRTLLLDVPGYRGHVAVRYKLISPELFQQRFSEIVKSSGGKLSDPQLLVDCCEEILVRETPDGELEPINPDGSVTTFSTGDLHTMLGCQAETAKEEVIALFSPSGVNPGAFNTHVQQVFGWLQGANEEEESEFKGN